ALERQGCALAKCARDRARHRQHHRWTVARTGTAQPPRNCRLSRTRPDCQREWQEARPTPDLWRTGGGTQCVIHGNLSGHQAQSRDQTVLPASIDAGQAKESRLDCLHAQVVGHFECHAALPSSLASVAPITLDIQDSCFEPFVREILFFQREISAMCDVGDVRCIPSPTSHIAYIATAFEMTRGAHSAVDLIK